MKHIQKIIGYVPKDEEVWRPIPELYPYEVSQFGRIRRIDKLSNGTIKETIMSTYRRDKSGYPQLRIRNCYYRKQMNIHRLVAAAFLDNPENLPIVNHINENKEDNSVWNLEYCDHSWNLYWSSYNRKGSLRYEKREEIIANNINKYKEQLWNKLYESMVKKYNKLVEEYIERQHKS